MRFGEALAFYQMHAMEDEILVVCRLLINTECVLGVWRGDWSPYISVLPVKNITDKVGIWHKMDPKSKIWILRKHPGLAMLSTAETGEEEIDGDNDEYDEYGKEQ